MKAFLKKIHPTVLSVILYLAFCFSNFYFARGTIVYAALLSGIGSNGAILNIVVAFFIGGLIPILLYQLVTTSVFKSLKARFLNASDMQHFLKVAFVLAHIVIGLISIAYFFAPLLSVYGNIFVPFFVTSIAFSVYLYFMCKSVE